MEDLTLWELTAYIDGRNEAYNKEKTEPMSNDEFDQLLATHNLPTDSLDNQRAN